MLNDKRSDVVFCLLTVLFVCLFQGGNNPIQLGPMQIQQQPMTVSNNYLCISQNNHLGINCATKMQLLYRRPT